MRLFIAVDINLRAKNLIAKKINFLKKKIDYNLKWVEKNNLHLTLKFIGEAGEEEKDFLIEALKNLNRENIAEYIQFNKLDAFPNSSKAKVIYLEVAEGRNSLKKLQAELESELLKYNFAKDQRDYIPHLTIGRSKNEYLNLAEEYLKINFLNIYARIEKVTLYESRLKRSGPEYIELFSIK